MQGQLGQRLVADLIREIASKNASGLFRLSRAKAIKALFFDSGVPVYAISNLSQEQLETRLVDQGLATQAQIEQAKRKADKPYRMPSTLVEMGVLGDDQMRKVVRDLVMGIIRSLFEWSDGDYVFDSKVRAAHDVTLEMSTADVLLEGARHAAGIQQIADALAPPDGVVVRAKTRTVSLDSGRLAPIESYVFSRIESATSISDVGSLTGIPESDAHKAICALVAAGFLKLVGCEKDVSPDEQEMDGEAMERLREDVTRRLHFHSSADHFEVLGLSRQATAAEIKASYYHLAKKLHPDRHHHSDLAELRSQLETLFAHITLAYDTLSDPAQRAAYEAKIKRSSDNPPASPVMTSPVVNVETPPVQRRTPEGKQNGSDELNAKISRVASSEPQPQASAGSIVADAPQQTRTPVGNPAQVAEHFYNQGRSLFEKKQYHGAVHMLREAIRLDSSRAPYHFHLGMALVRNPRTRHEAEEHLSKAAELDPYNAQIRVRLGLLYKEVGLVKKSNNYFREALSLDPDNRVAKLEVQATAKGLAAQAKSIWKSDVGGIAKKIFKK
ncbi:MAG TPA: DnaJ domain-containing protein [Blastocatellia bacterium]|nr:DnaJ domain-containing protein [Blastocatellia bacterium]